MAIDLIKRGRIPNRSFRSTKSSNTYLKTLIKVFIQLISALCFPYTKNFLQIQLSYL